MVYAGAGVCAVIGTLSPVCTAVISSCCGRHLTVPCYASVVLVVCPWLHRCRHAQHPSAVSLRFCLGEVWSLPSLVLWWSHGVRSLQSKPEVLGNQWIFPWHLNNSRYEVGEAKHKSRIIEALNFFWKGSWCMPSSLVLADFGQLVSHSCPPPGFGRDLSMPLHPCLVAVRRSWSWTTWWSLPRKASIYSHNKNRPKHRNSATYCQHSYFKRRDFEIS